VSRQSCDVGSRDDMQARPRNLTNGRQFREIEDARATIRSAHLQNTKREGRPSGLKGRGVFIGAPRHRGGDVGMPQRTRIPTATQVVSIRRNRTLEPSRFSS